MTGDVEQARATFLGEALKKRLPLGNVMKHAAHEQDVCILGLMKRCLLISEIYKLDGRSSLFSEPDQSGVVDHDIRQSCRR